MSILSNHYVAACFVDFCLLSYHFLDHPTDYSDHYFAHHFFDYLIEASLGGVPPPPFGSSRFAVGLND